MTITLSDIAKATTTYIDEQVTADVHGITRNLTEGKEGNYTVRVSNAAAADGGVRLRDVTLHLKVLDSEVALLLANRSPILTTRATSDPTDPELQTGDEVPEMFAFLQPSESVEPNDTWDPGEVRELEFRYRTGSPGTTSITAHVHATVLVEDLLPRGSGSDGEGTVTVKRG